MNNGDNILIKTVLNQIHEDGTCWVILPNGQNIHTELSNCEPLEVSESSEAKDNPDGLDHLKNKDLFEICAAEGIKYQQPANKAALIAAIRAHRAK